MPSVEITIVATTPPCPRCIEARAAARAIAAEYPESITIRELDWQDPAADRYGVLVTPTVFVDNLVVAAGRPPSRERLERLVKEMIAK